MADVNIKVDVKGSDKSADDFGKKLGKGLEKALGKLGLGDFGKGISSAIGGKGDAGASKMGGDMSSSVTMGVTAGLAAGGVTALLGFIADVLKDLPIITGIFKILKLIIMLLLMPLIPILKPVLLLLAGMAKAFAPIMRLLVDTMSKVLDPTINRFITIWTDFLANNMQRLANVLSAVVDVILAIPLSFINIGFDALVAVLDWVTKNLDVGAEQIIKVLTSVKDLLTFSWEDIINFLTDVSVWLGESWGVVYEAMKDVGKWLGESWDKVEVVMAWVNGFLEDSWDNIKTALEDFASVLKRISDTINSLRFRGESPGTKASKSFGTPKDYGFGDFVVTPSGVISAHPDDYIFGMKNPKGRGGGGLTVNINNPVVRSDTDIRSLVRQIELHLYKNQRRFNSYV